MAEGPAPAATAGALSIDKSYEAFDSFPWFKNKPFLVALIDTLGGVGALHPQPGHKNSSIFCRTVSYRRHTSIQISIIEYCTYLSNNPQYPSIDEKLLQALYDAKAQLQQEKPNLPDAKFAIATAVAAGNKPKSPAWQQKAPQQELRVTNNTSPTAGEGTDAPYPDEFAKVVEAVQTGKEMEGIRDIPNTVVRPDGLSPFGKMNAPKKPWERGPPSGLAAEQSPYDAGPVLDREFPPAEMDAQDGAQDDQGEKS